MDMNITLILAQGMSQLAPNLGLHCKQEGSLVRAELSKLSGIPTLFFFCFYTHFFLSYLAWLVCNTYPTPCLATIKS